MIFDNLTICGIILALATIIVLSYLATRTRSSKTESTASEDTSRS
jgi:hypothetical protein